MELHWDAILAALVGLATALIQWKGKRAAMNSAAGLTSQLLSVVGGVEEAAREDPAAGALTKKRIKEAAELSGAEEGLHKIVKRITGVIK